VTAGSPQQHRGRDRNHTAHPLSHLGEQRPARSRACWSRTPARGGSNSSRNSAPRCRNWACRGRSGMRVGFGETEDGCAPDALG
jgi:hypothetical protein